MTNEKPRRRSPDGTIRDHTVAAENPIIRNRLNDGSAVSGQGAHVCDKRLLCVAVFPSDLKPDGSSGIPDKASDQDEQSSHPSMKKFVFLASKNTQGVRILIGPHTFILVCGSVTPWNFCISESIYDISLDFFKRRQKKRLLVALRSDLVMKFLKIPYYTVSSQEIIVLFAKVSN